MSLESLARALRGNLTYDSTCERDWDRLTAMAWGSVKAEHRSARESLLNSLGVSLIGFKHAMQPHRHRRAVEDLRDCLRWRTGPMGRQQREKIAEAAITEWVVDMCESCLGAMVIFDSKGVCRPCLTCGQTGKRRYSDAERQRVVGLANRHMDTAHMLISFGVGHAIRQAALRMPIEK